jgi:hypothetical protein
MLLSRLLVSSLLAPFLLSYAIVLLGDNDTGFLIVIYDKMNREGISKRSIFVITLCLLAS